jgi:predicted PurR-regulated permease PerM
MEKTATSDSGALHAGRAIDIAIRLGALALLLAWCFQILKPFVSPAVWGIIIAVALHPVYERLNARMGGRRRLSAAVLTLAALLIIIAPGTQLVLSSVDSLKHLISTLEGGGLKIPPPPDSVEDWPVIGASVKSTWQKGSDNLASLIVKFEPQIVAFAKWLFMTLFSTTAGLLMFAVSLVIAGILMASAQGGGRMARRLFVRLAGERGTEFAEISSKTVRNVVKGIIGVSMVQSLLIGLGLAAAGIPAAGLWALLCLILAIIQIGPAPVILPVIIYAFAKLGTVTAVILTLWLLAAAISDGPMKAILMGRGAAVPMLVIFLGAIGGFISFGFLGLFIGAVILSVGYKLFEAWLQEDGDAIPAAEASAAKDQMQ